MNHIRIYHTVWNMQLQPNEFRTYCAVLRFMNTSTRYANVCRRKLGAAVGLSVASVSRGIKALADRGLIRIVRKRCQGRQLANGYLVTPQEGRYTMLPCAALALPVTACGFKLYAFMIKCQSSDRTAFPSLSEIAAAVGYTVKTAIEQIKALIRWRALDKNRRFRKIKGGYARNLYRLWQITSVGGAKKRRNTPHTRVPSGLERF